MRVTVLGPLRVLDGDREIDPGGPMSRALVARLALAGGRPVAVGVLVDDLWGEEVPGDATNALQSIVSRTRRRLPEGTLRSTPGGYVLRADVDAEDFRRLVAAGRAGEALRLWRGEPLAGLPDVPFTARLAAGLTDLRLAALEQDLSARTPDAAVVAELAELAREHPYRDGPALLHLRALVECGRTGEALTAYETLRRRLADDLGADPSPALQELHARLLRGDVGPAPHAAGRPDAGSRLPVAVTSFVGRDDAVAALRRALDEHRLVTLLGPGGAGKTRLAVETARGCLDRFPSAWLVELATVTSGEEVVPAVLSAMGRLEVSVRDRPGAPWDVGHRLAEAAGEAEGLVVLDNCEHLVDDVATVAERLLEVAPRLRVLATSREALRIIGEFTYVLSPLEVPGDGVAVAAARRSSAVRLFTERARAVDHAFVVDEATLPAVREICRRLDGQPLAIELAAARLRTLTVGEVAARLSDRFRLLTGGSRTLPRHRTLRAVVEWSWDLLTDRERDLAERAAVFPAGVTAEGAAFVLGGGATPDDAAELLDSLVDKSLLVPVRGEQRYRMLETLREYGAERLVERGVAEEVRSAHLDLMVRLGEMLATWATDSRQISAFRRMDLDRGNLTAALRYAVERGDRGRAARLVCAMAVYWAVRNENVELGSFVESVLGTPGEAEPAVEMFLEGMGVVGRYSADPTDERWRDGVARILALWDTHRPEDPRAAIVMAVLGHFGAAEGRAVPPIENLWLRSMTGLARVSLLENAGRSDEIVELLDGTIEGFRACGEAWGLASCLGLRGMLEAYDGNFERARAVWREALPLLEALGAEQDTAYYRLRELALELAEAGVPELDRLRRDLTAERDAALARGDRRRAGTARLALGHVERIAARPGESARHLRALLGERHQLGEFLGTQFQAVVRAALAVALARSGDVPGAVAELDVAVRIGGATGDMPILAFVAGMAAALVRELGDDERAVRLLAAADVVRGRPDLSFRDTRDLAASLRESLGDERFEGLFAAAVAAGREAALALLVESAEALREPAGPGGVTP